MSRRYSPDHKRLVLRLLNAFNADVTATSHFTGIPERTLRDWFAEAKRTGGLPRSGICFTSQRRR